MSETLQALRESIDKADEAMIRALAERLRAVREVGVWKKTAGIPPLDTGRWKEVLRHAKDLAKKEGVDEMLIERIYTLIHEHALEVEEKER